MREEMTAKSGTPMSIPTKPKMPPKKMMAKRTPKDEMPVLSPKILGPRMLPSNCWRAKTKMTK